MTLISHSKDRYIDKAYLSISQNLQALNLFSGKVDSVSALARHVRPVGSCLSQEALYAIFLEKISFLLKTKKTISQKTLNLTLLDPSSANSCSWRKSSAVAIQCLFQSQKGFPSSRVFLLMKDSLITQSKVCMYAIGNVDLFLVNPSGLEGKYMLEHGMVDSAKLHALSPKIWLEISKHLDGGQRLNVGEIFSIQKAFFSDTSSEDAYYQHYNQLGFYLKHSPNGSLILKRLKSRFFVVHQSPYKQGILSSKELRVSRGGCIGSLVYTTELIGEKGCELGGHALGLLERKSISFSEFKNNLILAQVEKQGNVFSNWIDKFGRGSLIHAARENAMMNLSEKKSLVIDQNCRQSALDEYKKIFSLLQLSLTLRYVIQEKTHLPADIAIKAFSAFIKQKSLIDLSSKSSLLNSIYFEIIKDYILFFQDDEYSRKFRSKESFNMIMQYEIFFILCPELKKHWDTTNFTPSFETIRDVLTEKGFLTEASKLLDFKIFFLERFCYYINISLLEGSITLETPTKCLFFEQLSAQAPNLAALLYYYSLKSHYKTTTFFKKFTENLNSEYHTFYQERAIKIAIKSGFARTEEIGLTQESVVDFFDFDIKSESDTDVALFPFQSLPFLKIQGISQTNGFTTRPPSDLKR